MITKAMIGKGYDNDVIKLDISPHDDGVVCVIGEYWFYFGGFTAEEYCDVEAYKMDIHRDVIIDKIYDALDEFRKDEVLADEYAYYEAFLKEARCDK